MGDGTIVTKCEWVSNFRGIHIQHVMSYFDWLSDRQAPLNDNKTTWLTILYGSVHALYTVYISGVFVGYYNTSKFNAIIHFNYTVLQVLAD